MPSLPPLFSGFRRRNRRYQQPRENDRQVWQACKNALIKLFPRSCFANARRQEEVEQVIRDEEQEQNLTRVMQQAEALAKKLRENGNVGKTDQLQKPTVTITEEEMKILAEELEPGCTELQRAKDTEKNEGSSKEKSTEREAAGGENVKPESENSVDNFSIGDIERLDDEGQNKSESVAIKPEPTNSLVNQDEMPGTSNIHKVRILEQNIESGEANENLNHHLNPFYMYQEPIEQDSSEEEPPNATSQFPTTPVSLNLLPSGTQVPNTIANVWAVNEGWGPPPQPTQTIPKSIFAGSTPDMVWGPPPILINDAPPPQPTQTIPESPFITESTPDVGWGPPPTVINDAPQHIYC